MPAPTPPKNKRDFSWGRTSKTFAFWILILLIPVALIQLSGSRNSSSPKINYTRYRAELARENIKTVTIQGGKYIQGKFRSPWSFEGGKNIRKLTQNRTGRN